MKRSLAAANISARLTQPKAKKTTNKLRKVIMSEEKKDKPQVDVRDLKPNKDAKGGGGHSAQGTGKGAQGTKPTQQ
jgi:hypothetical protein